MSEVFSSTLAQLLTRSLVEKLMLLGVEPATCNWVFSFLTKRQQTVKVGSQTLKTVLESTGSPQGCVLSPLLFSLLTHDCTATFNTNHIVKFANDTTVIGLITDNDESAYRMDVEQLGVWCRSHNLIINVDKIKEMVIDFRKAGRDHHQDLTIDDAAVKRVSSVTFLGVHLADDLSFSINTTAVIKKAQKRLHSLRRLRKTGLSTLHLTNFYRGTIENIPTQSFTAWFGSCKSYKKCQLNRIVKTARRIAGAPLSSLEEIYKQHCIRRAISIIRDPHHPSHDLFSLLPSYRWYRSISCRTSRMLVLCETDKWTVPPLHLHSHSHSYTV
ncbi:uncharacterized protein LOC113029584 [Astatotilapia calliptera]|uniref:uncharacterized protein LOC113029584 n=1 Tax=Astatotilapia calliptera TaxID=8154 RepID=UPI000E4046EA|nr:uncharacterized protein LOC113029584 [Astatotilapia calliptera]XP_026036333.1 uncharacterized protein LOC113029584 [Astatotilapia calliptera]